MQKGILSLLLFSLLITSCSNLGKMQKCITEVRFNAVPNPLQATGDKVKVTIENVFPKRYFNKTARLVFTPTLVTASGETTFPPYTVQGEGVAGNDKIIPFKEGGSYTYRGDITYHPSMEVSELILKIRGYRGKKEKTFEPIKIADGVIKTQYSIRNDDKVLLADDQYNRFADQQQKAVINYLVGSPDVRPTELQDGDMKQMGKFLANVAANPDYVITGINIEGYASPEGELRKNENLADDRAESARKTVASLMKTAKLKDKPELYKLSSGGEDWEGFKELLERSKIEDKALILRIVNMNTDVTRREEEIRNLAATYEEVAEQILPKLRRSNITVNYRITGRTDEKILMLARTKPGELNANELQYAATLTQDLNEKLSFYKAAEDLFPDDYRGAHNMGWVYMQQDKADEARKKFEQANSIRFNAWSQNNLGVLERRAGNREKALQHYLNAKEAGPDVNYNIGLVQFQLGEYAAASTSMAGYNTMNHALVHTLSGDLERAQQVLNASPEKETAQGQYLAAIIAARMQRTEVMIEKLTAAVKQDNSLKERAAKDREFIRYWNNEAFKALIR